MNKRKLISELKWQAKMAVYKANHCSRVLQAEDLTEEEKRKWEDWRLCYIAKEGTLLELVEDMQNGVIK